MAISDVLEEAIATDSELNQQVIGVSTISLHYKNQAHALTAKIQTISALPSAVVKSTIQACKASVAAFEAKKTELDRLKVKSKTLVESIKALKARCPLVIEKETKTSKLIDKPDADLCKRLSDVLIIAKKDSSAAVSVTVNELIKELIAAAELNQKAIDIALSTHITFIAKSSSEINEQSKKVLEAIQAEKARRALASIQEQTSLQQSTVVFKSPIAGSGCASDVIAHHQEQQQRSLHQIVV